MAVEKSTVDAIFLAAGEIASDLERQAYLDRVCGDDAQLRGEVERLLHARFSTGVLAHQLGAALDKTVDLSAPAERLGSFIGPYKLLEQIGEGGMGVVYMADQQAPVRRRVALKIIRPGMDTRQVIARFEAERQALALMDHPNIARVLDAGATESGRPYFVMELVRGIPITDYCDQNKLTVAQRLELFIQVCHALQHAHQKGIIHRDIKPSNVLVTLHDGKPVPKIIDFGVAKATNQQLTDKTLFTQFAQMVGTPLYMSPEQAEMSALDVDTRSDIYSLGVLLYELLTGTTPFDRKRVREAGYDEVRRMIREEEPPRPSTLGETRTAMAAHRKLDPDRLAQLIRGDLDWIVMKCLEKDRTRRYETASGLARDVQRYLEDQPVEACPPSTAYRFRKFARRNRVALVTGVVVSTALVLGTVVSTWQAVRATRAERAAEGARSDEAEQRKLAERQKLAAEQERAKAEEQRVLAEQQRTAAEANFQKARTAVDDYFTLVSESTLLDVPGLQSLRKDLLEGALRFYEESAVERADDPAVLAELAATGLRVAEIHHAMARNDDAISAVDQALNIIDRLRHEYPQSKQHQRRLAGFWKGWRGIQVSGEQPKNPEAAFQSVLRLEKTWEILAEENPDVAAFQSDLAAIDDHIGELVLSAGQKAEAVKWFDKAKSVLEKLVRDRPDVPEFKADLARAYFALTLILPTVGRPRDAEVTSRRALELSEQLVAGFPTIPAYRAGLAEALTHFGGRIAPTQPDEAQASLRRAMELAKSLADQFPDLHLYWERWFFAGVQLMESKGSQGDPGGAQEVARAIFKELKVRLAAHPDDPKFRQHIVELCEASDRHPASFAGELLEQSVEALAELTLARPSITNREELAHAYRRLGRVNCLAGRWDEAGQNLKQSAELLDKLSADDAANGTFYRIYQAQALSELSLVLHAQERFEDSKRIADQSDALYQELFREFPPPKPRGYADLRNMFYAYHRHGLVQLYLGDSDGYRYTCKAMKPRIGIVQDRVADFYLAWSCCLGPDALDKFTMPITRIAGMLNGRPNDADLLTILGILRYRSGQLEESARGLTEAEAAFATQKYTSGTVLYPQIFLAMIHQRLGHADEARRRLDEVRAALDQRPSEVSWDHRITMAIFRREAEALIPARP